MNVCGVGPVFSKSVKRRYGMRPFCQTNMMDFIIVACYTVYAAEDSAVIALAITAANMAYWNLFMWWKI